MYREGLLFLHAGSGKALGAGECLSTQAGPRVGGEVKDGQAASGVLGEERSCSVIPAPGIVALLYAMAVV